MITAASITDEQIRELRARAQTNGSPWDAQGYGPSDVVSDCDVALFDINSVGAAERRAAARARCAEVLNAQNHKRCAARRLRHQHHIDDVCEGSCCTTCGGPIDNDGECRC